MIYEYDAFIEVPEKLGEEKMAEIDCTIAFFVEDEFGYPVEFSILGQIDEEKGDAEIEKVVRCKDCKWLKTEYCRIRTGVLFGDSYCSFGERDNEDE